MVPEFVVSMEFVLDPPDAARDPQAALASGGGVAIVVENGRRIDLDPGASRSPAFVRVIDGQAQLGRPVSLELDGDGRILRLFLPHMSTVTAVRPLDRGVIGFELLASHTLHRLTDSNDRFDEYHQLLRRAMASDAIVIVTEGNDHVAKDIRIIDADRGPLVVEAPTSWLRRYLDKLSSWCLCNVPGRLAGSIRQSQAQQLFDKLAERTCDPQAIAEPCIPFLYPDNGCWARAHEMRRLMALEGYEPCKVWIQGDLLMVETATHPFCEVYWTWHVAPTLCRRRRWTEWAGLSKIFTPEKWVFDPSIFNTPVTVDVWKAAMGNPSAKLTMTSGRIYHLWAVEPPSHSDQPGKYDETYDNTNLWLGQFRMNLQHRVLDPDFGPPPYDHCGGDDP